MKIYLRFYKNLIITMILIAVLCLLLSRVDWDLSRKFTYRLLKALYLVIFWLKERNFVHYHFKVGCILLTRGILLN